MAIFIVQMKKEMTNWGTLLLQLAVAIMPVITQAQTAASNSDKKTADSSKISNLFNKVIKKANVQTTPNTTEVIDGLKQALEIGAQNSCGKLSLPDGYFGNKAVKILLPKEAQNAEKTLRSLGMGKLVDDAILTMNRAAEDAAKSAAPLMIDAVKKMTLQDAWGILYGTDTAATSYLRNKTSADLTAVFKPVIAASIEKTGVTSYWNSVFSNYNRFAAKKINPDLTSYVTEQALNGLFFQVGEEEKAIRKNPAARTTDLLRKVFTN